jgi:hypothetical protein
MSLTGVIRRMHETMEHISRSGTTALLNILETAAEREKNERTRDGGQETKKKSGSAKTNARFGSSFRIGCQRTRRVQ